MNTFAKSLSVFTFLIGAVELVGWYISVPLVYPYSIVFYVFVGLYLLMLVYFFRHLIARPVNASWSWLVFSILYLLILFCYLQYPSLFWQYGMQAQNAGIELQKETAAWRTQHCTPVTDTTNTCTNSNVGLQKYQCDDGSEFCGI